ncbi:ATP-binding protein [Planotetraspora sp. A-T 1434]|uniref:AAA family ATPase n=1 Tax=Planotetraspora sp. A-T 1434 TaxID=2979219 RepID=UPI0021BEA8B8|nr:ATP-binding protein [Planotetraspora sp. A-T 1434]MCT9935088.1 ATP-binding protein [Planotetraspora sp. A-T 1434]
MLQKPAEIVDRDKDWEILSDFLRPRRPERPGASIAAVTGRRRAGKTYLLGRFSEQAGGLYYEARQEDSLLEAQERLRAEIAAYEPARAAEINVMPLGQADTWDRLLEAAMDVTFARRTEDMVPPVIIDEFPYLLRDTPVLQSILHQLYDTRMFRPRESARGGLRLGYFDRLIQGKLLLCGSAMSIMQELGHGSRPLFGRLAWTMTVEPFDHIDMARFWGIHDREVALLLYAVLGGAAGYLELTEDRTGLRPPQTLADFDSWVARTLLTPKPGFLTETEIWHLLREDPRAGDKVIYQQAMKAIADGATTATQVGGVLEKPKEEMEPIVDRLVAMGYVDERSELFPSSEYVLRLRDPVIRFHYAVVEPAVDLLRDAGDPGEVWEHSASRFRSQVLGPAFEEVVSASASRMLRNRGIEIGYRGWTTVHDPETRKNHEVDLVGLEPYAVPRDKKARIVVIGEAKATRRPRGMKDLERLRRIRELLSKRRRAADAKLVIFSMYGFSDALLKEAGNHPDEVVLFGLDELFGWKG